MNVVNATKEDIKGWLKLASEVEYLFGPMVDDPNFLEALEKNIERGTAFCVRENDGSPRSNLVGGVLFSSSNAPSYKIGWLSVSSHSRGKGVATALLNHILSLIHTPAELYVITFGDDIPDGQAARRAISKVLFYSFERNSPEWSRWGFPSKTLF